MKPRPKRRVSWPVWMVVWLLVCYALGAVLPENANWTFDTNGNIASKTLRLPGGTMQTRTFTYDAADRMTKIVKTGGNTANPAGTVTLHYDANGNLISDSTGKQYTWNALDQLTRLQTTQLTANFRYDPLGRRIKLSKGSTLKTYLYDGLEVLSDGTSKFLHGAGIDEPLQINGPTLNASYLSDHLGSTTQLLDSTNATAKARLDYKSYGKLEGDVNNPSLTNPFTYTGREDDGTGLMYYRARYYDSELEMFISEDPMGDAQRYVGGNPMGFVDPMGLYNVAFFHNPSLISGDPCHPGITFSQNGKTHLYYKTINQTGVPGIPYQGDLYEFNNKNFVPGGIDVYQLDSSIFKNEQVLDTLTQPYGPLPIPNYSTNCSSYAADVLNKSIRGKNKNLKSGQKLYPEVNGLTPWQLYNSLKSGGYITPTNKIHIKN